MATVGKPGKVFGNSSNSSDIIVPKYGSVDALTNKQVGYFIPGRSFGPAKSGRRSQSREIGYPGLSIHGGYVTEEYLGELQGTRGVQVYDTMQREDPVIGAMLNIAGELIHNASVLVNPAPQNPDANKSLMARDLVKTSIFDMGNTWTDTLTEILTFLGFGFSVAAVWHRKRDGYNRNKWKSSRYADGKWGWAGISLRSQTTLDSWETDKNGRAIGMWQLGPPKYERVLIPFTHAGHFRTRTDRENPEGISVLRNAYRGWWIRRHLEETEAIGIERDCTGIPVLITPEGVNLWDGSSDANATLTRCNNIVRLLKTDKYHGVVLPFGYELKVLTTAGQRPHNSDTVISRWDQRIATTLLADMLLIGHERVGSFALVQEKVDLFSSALESYAARIAGVFNGELIPRMMMLNGIPQEYWPTMEFGPVETPSLIDLAEYLKAMADVGIYPDEAVALYLRQVARFPPPKEGESAKGEPPPQEEVKEPSKQEGTEEAEPTDEEAEAEEKLQKQWKSSEWKNMIGKKGLRIRNDPISRYSLGLDK